MKREIQGEVSELLKRSSAVRALLIARRHELQAEIEEIDIQLKLIPTGTKVAVSGEKIGPDNEHLVQLSIPEVVKGILKRNPNGIRSSQVIEQANKIRPLKDARIHTALFKLRKRGLVEHRGERPNVVFSLTEKGAATMSP